MLVLIGARQLALPLTSCSIWEIGSLTSPGHVLVRVDPGDVGTESQVLEHENWRDDLGGIGVGEMTQMTQAQDS